LHRRFAPLGLSFALAFLRTRPIKQVRFIDLACSYRPLQGKPILLQPDYQCATPGLPGSATIRSMPKLTTDISGVYQRRGEVDRALIDKSERAIVQCKGFRCLAFRGPDGEWRNIEGKRLAVLQVLDQV
jgi:hypothetical protein